MMRKKGISPIIGYVLLIVMTVGLSLMVFSYLKLYTPKDKPECNSEVHLVISDFTCINKMLTITFKNKGLFKIDAVYVRIGNENQKVRDLVNNNNIFFGAVEGQKGLFPGKSITKSYPYPAINSGNLTLEIQPAVFDENDLAICENAVVVQPIECTSTTE